MWPDIPIDVIEYVRGVVRYASDEITERLANQPNIRETSLDDALVNAIGRFAAPKRLPSNTIVTIEVHNIGGLRQWHRWELADIAFVVHVSSDGSPVVQKIGLLQCKRLYPENYDVDADDPVGFMYGLNGLLDPPEVAKPPLRRTTYRFSEDSIYGAISQHDEQLKRIHEFHEKFGESVFYLLYHPPEIPFERTLPAVSYHSIALPPLGPRVVRSSAIGAILEEKSRTERSPSFSEIRRSSSDENWRLETWTAELLLRCTVGRQYSKADHELIDRLIQRRTGPIGAAIRINIQLSEDS